jgi:hypothetical protein
LWRLASQAKKTEIKKARIKGISQDNVYVCVYTKPLTVYLKNLERVSKKKLLKLNEQICKKLMLASETTLPKCELNIFWHFTLGGRREWK